MSDAVWVPVNAEMKGFIGTLVKEASGAAKKGGAAVEKEFAASGKRAGQAVAEGLAASASKVEAISTKLGTARKSEAQAAADVTAAEQKLEALRESGVAKASQLAQAEQQLETAKNKQADAAVRVAREESNLEAARSGTETRSLALSRAEDNLAAARTNQATQQAKLRTSELALQEAREVADAKAAALEAAEGKLMGTRRLYGENSKQAAAAEKEFNTARKQSLSAQTSLAKAEGNSKKARAELESATDTLKAKELTLKAVNDDLARSVRASDDAHKSLGQTMSGMAGKVGDLAQKYSIHAGAVLGGIGMLAKSSVDYAAEAEQSYGAVESIFGEHAEGIIAASKGSAEAVGLSGREYRELSASTGAMLKNMGMPLDVVAGKSQDLVGVAADLAATFGGTTADAVEAVGSLMRGEADPIERYGVSIKQSDVNARMAAQGLDKLTGEAAKQAQAQTMLQMLTEQTASAQGQFNRETDTAAHKQQVATAKLNDAKEAIGTGLLPIYADLMDKAAGVARVVGEHPQLFLAIGGAVAVVSAAVMGIAVVSPIFTAISVAAAAAGMSMWGYVAAQAAALAPILAIVAAVAALGVALWAFFTKTELGRELWAKFTAALTSRWEGFKNAMVASWNWLVSSVWTPFTGWIGSLGSKWSGFVEGLKSSWTSFRDNAAEVVTNVIGRIGELVTNVQQIPGKVKGVFGAASQWLINAGSDIISGLWSGMQDMWNRVASWLTDLPSLIRNSIGSISFNFGGIFGRNAVGSYQAYVDGGIRQLEAYANGGSRLPRRAVIEPPHGARGLVQWAEASTKGEAFIPMGEANRVRSTAITAKVADAFGYALVDKKTGEPYNPGVYGGDLGPQVVNTFADGGITGDDIDKFVKGQRSRGYAASRPLEGAPYDWGGINWGDCSGTMSAVARFAAGINPFGGRFATGNQAESLRALGFKSGRGSVGDLRIGFKNGGPAGGHTAGTLPNGVNVEMGGGRGNGQYGGRAAGAWDSYFDTFFYLPVKKKVEFNDPKVSGLSGTISSGQKLSGAELDALTQDTAYSAASASATPTTETVTVQLTPEEAAKATAAKELGDQSIMDVVTDGVFDMLGMGDSLTKKLLTSKGSDLWPSGDSIVTTATRDQARTSVAQSHAETIQSKAESTLTPTQMAKNPQLGQEAKKPEVTPPARWGEPFFAREIARSAKANGLDAEGAKIGMAVALVESGSPLKMWANRAVPESLKFKHDAVGSDYDSVGLFQQRDNGAWGTVEQRMTPSDSAGMFFNAMLRKFPNWRELEPGAVAQGVQVSAYPDRYAKQMARGLQLANESGVFNTEALSKVDLQTAFEEFAASWDGEDFGLGETATLLNSEELARGLLNGVAAQGKKRTGVPANSAGPVASYKVLMQTGDYDGRMANIGIHEDNDLVGAVLDARRAGAVFDSGGIGRGKGLLPKDVVAPERVLSPRQTQAFDDLVYKHLPRQERDGGAGTTVVINLDGQEVLRKRIDRAEGQISLNTEDIARLRRSTGVAVAGTTRGSVM